MGKKVKFVPPNDWRFALRTSLFIQIFWGESRGGVSREDLARGMSKPEEEIRQSLAPMIEEGVVHPEDRDGKYFLAHPYTIEFFHKSCYYEGESRG